MSNFDQKFYSTVTWCTTQILKDISSHKNIKKQLYTEKMLYQSEIWPFCNHDVM